MKQKEKRRSRDGAAILRKPLDLVFQAEFKGLQMMESKMIRPCAKRFLMQVLIDFGVFFSKGLNTIFKRHNIPPFE